MSFFFHGTSAASAPSLANGEPLEGAVAASLHLDGEPGFYLATDEGDAEFFAVRRPEGGVVLRYDFSDDALNALFDAGAVLRGVPGRPPPYFNGDELFVPTSAFGVFNKLLANGEIHVAH